MTQALVIPTLPAPAGPPHPVLVYLARLGPGSRRAMAQGLGIAAREIAGLDAIAFPWASVRYEHVAALRAKLAATYSPAYCNKILAAVRGVVKEAWRLGIMDAETSARARDVGPVKGERLPPGRALTGSEIADLFAACGDSNAGRRDKAMLGVLLGAGLRRSEVTALDLADFDSAAGTIAIRNPKGGTDRLLPLPQGSIVAIAEWLERRGLEPGPLLVAVSEARKGDKIDRDHRLSDQAVLKRLLKLAKAAKVAPFSCHDCRRTFITKLLDDGNDLFVVAKLSGHKSLRVLERYDRRTLDAGRKAVEASIRIPFERSQP